MHGYLFLKQELAIQNKKASKILNFPKAWFPDPQINMQEVIPFRPPTHQVSPFTH